MPIKGLQTRAAVLGHIKIGGRKKIGTPRGDRIIPTKFDHFVVTTNEQGELGYLPDDALDRKLSEEQRALFRDENTQKIWGKREMRDETGEVLHDKSGAILYERYLVKTVQLISDKKLDEMNSKLHRILVALPFDDIDQNLVTSLSVYDREGCRCRGDGETGEWIDPRSGNTEKVNCPCQMLTAYLSDNDDPADRPHHEKRDKGMSPNDKKGFICKANGTLRLKVAAAKTLGGVHLFRTTSLNSIRQLMSAMQEIADISGGVLAGIPLVFEVDSKTVRPFHNKPPQKAFVVNLTYKASAIEFLEDAIKHASLREQMKQQLATVEIAQLPAPGFENPHEQVAIAQEFYAGAPPENYIDATGEETQRLGAPPQDDAPPPSDSDAPDSEVRNETKDEAEAKKKAEVKKKAADKKAADKKAADKKAADKKAADKKAETKSSDSAEQKKEPVDKTTSSEPQETAQAPQEEKTDTPKPEQASDEKPAEETPETKEAVPSQDGDKENPQDTKETEGNLFPSVFTEKPEGGDISPATKKLRKSLIVTCRGKGYKDAEARQWIEDLWGAKTSAALLTWQVEAMLKVLQ